MSMGETAVKNALVGNVHLVKLISGYSAYEVAVANGFNGTQKEWLESIRGEPGYTPQKGVDYFDGEKGEPGSLELFGEFDAVSHRIANLVYPSADADAANKKYVDDAVTELENNVTQYASENYVSKNSPLDANGKTISNVATPVNDTDAVNKKYVHDFFQGIQCEDISADFIDDTILNGINIVATNVFKQGNVICGEVTFTSTADLTDSSNILFRINSNYKPLVRILTPVLVMTSGVYYLSESTNAYIENVAGNVVLGAFEQTEGFKSNFLISFTYLCA